MSNFKRRGKPDHQSNDTNSKDGLDSTIERVPLNVKRQKRLTISDFGRNILSVENEEPGFVYRWVNKVRDRVRRLMLRGYEPVTHSVDIGDISSDLTGHQVGTLQTMPVGMGVESVLMRIPQELYDEDQAAKEKINQSIDAAIRKKPAQGTGLYGSVELSVSKKDQ